jgi:hypothetical protein
VRLGLAACWSAPRPTSALGALRSFREAGREDDAPWSDRTESEARLSCACRALSDQIRSLLPRKVREA